MSGGLEFIITPGNGVMTIGATTLDVDSSALGAEIRTVKWSGTAGKVTYTDDFGSPANVVPVPLSDPTPFLPFVNAWCTAALAGSQVPGSSPGIGLAQVQQIKTGLVEILFNVKRQAPIAFTVAAGALSWDASDDAAAAMAQQLLAGTVGMLQTLATDLAGDFASIIATAGTGIVSPFAVLVAAVNSALSGVVTDVNAALSGAVSDVNAALAGVVSDVNAALTGVETNVNAALSGLHADVNASFTSLIGDVNTAFTALTTSINTNVVAAFNTTIGSPTSPAVGTLNHDLAVDIGGSATGPFATVANLSNLTAPSVGPESVGPESTGPESIRSESIRSESINPETVAASESFSPTITAFSALVGSIPWIPFGHTSTVNVTNVELAGILGAILSRRTTLQATRLAKEAAIAALTTVADAIAYDVTVGW